MVQSAGISAATFVFSGVSV